MTKYHFYGGASKTGDKVGVFTDYIGITFENGNVHDICVTGFEGNPRPHLIELAKEYVNNGGKGVPVEERFSNFRQTLNS